MVESIKKAALEAVAADNPTSVMFGRVISTSPLKINVEQKMTLDKAQLILTRNVTDYQTSMTLSGTQSYYLPGDGGSPIEVDHSHAIGQTTVTIYNGLSVGEEVLLLRMQGGQKFIVLDRLG